MKKGTKIALIVALCCIGLGLVLFLLGLSMVGFDIFDSLRNGSMDTTNSVVKTVPVNENFRNIEIADVERDLFILPSADGNCHVEYTDSDLYIHEIEVKGDTLTISREDIGSWEDHFFVMWGDNSYVKVYLPSGTYEDLDLSTVSGDITLKDIHADDLSANTTSGDITLDRVLISGMMDLDTTSGDIELDEVDSEAANFSTGSGDISGDILSGKDFRADSGSGEIRVPQSDSNAGIWDLSTGSGDIDLNIAR